MMVFSKGLFWAFWFFPIVGEKIWADVTSEPETKAASKVETGGEEIQVEEEKSKEKDKDKDKNDELSKEMENQPNSYWIWPKDDNRKSIFWFPLFSYALPGLDQWYEGDYLAGAGYTTGWWLSNIYANVHLKKIGTDDEDILKKAKEYSLDPYEKNDNWRKYQLGSQTAASLGRLSAYHSFLEAVPSHKASGRYTFLTQQSSMKEVFFAPFDFSYLKRTTTWMPLGLITLLSLYDGINPDDHLSHNLKKTSFKKVDSFLTGSASYNAGVSEEAFFRGWILPLSVEALGGDSFWANFSTSLFFAAAHYPSNPMPLPQALLGFHLGQITLNSGGSIGEAIFIHTWWDILAIGVSCLYEKKPENAIIRLPSLHWTF